MNIIFIGKLIMKKNIHWVLLLSGKQMQDTYNKQHTQS